MGDIKGDTGSLDYSSYAFGSGATCFPLRICSGTASDRMCNLGLLENLPGRDR